MLAGLSLGMMAAEEGITVTGRGRVEALPDTVELEGMISGQAELAADAVVKYRDNKRRVEQALKELKIDQLSIKWSGIKLGPGYPDTPAGQMAAMRGQVQAGSDRIAVSDSATLVLSGVREMDERKLLDTLVQLIDASKDSGLNVLPMGKPVLATFKLVDTSKAEKEAYARAMKDARDRAARLAELAGLELGTIRAVQVTSTSTSSRSSVSYNQYGYRQPHRNSPGQLSSIQLMPIPVEVTLRVQFNISTL